jgi:hypothetical protein
MPDLDLRCMLSPIHDINIGHDGWMFARRPSFLLPASSSPFPCLLACLLACLPACLLALNIVG